MLSITDTNNSTKSSDNKKYYCNSFTTKTRTLAGTVYRAITVNVFDNFKMSVRN